MNNPFIDKTLLQNIIALWRYLGKHRRTQFVLLLLLMLVAVFAEIISIGAVIPFLTALTTPDLLFEANWLQPVLASMGITASEQLLLPLTLVFIGAAVFAAGIRILLFWANSRLTASMGVQLSSELYTRVLYQPYEYHAANNSSQLISMVTQKVGGVINAGIMHVLMLISALVLSLAIIVTLIAINVWVALTTFVVLGGGYVLVGYLVRQRIAHNGQIIAQNQPLAVKCIQEGLGGICDVIIGGSQPVFSRLYTEAAYRMQMATMKNGLLGNLPKPVLEVFGITLIAAIAYVMQASPAGQESALPILGALVLGAQRLLPSLQ